MLIDGCISSIACVSRTVTIAMIPASLISEQHFILGVTAVAVLPRLPSDKTRCSIGGGNVGYPFRRLLLVLAGINFIRWFASARQDASKWILIAGLLNALGIIAQNFLCLLTPYLLQKWLANCINIRPGQDLTSWLWAVSIFGVVGVYLSRAIHPRFFALEEIAHAMSCIPVISTLKMYNRVTTPSHGRGTVMAQTVLLVEYWHIISQIACAIGYAFGNDFLVAEMGGGAATAIHNDSSQIVALLRALRESDFMTDWSRVLVHAIFMNQLDELSYVRVNEGDNDEEGGDNRREANGCTRTELVALSKK